MFDTRVGRYIGSFFAVLKRTLMAHRVALLLLLSGVFLPLLIFGQLAEEIWENEDGFSGDVPILLAIHATATPQLDIVASVLTRLGVFWGVFPVAVVILITLLVQRRWHRLTYSAITFLGSIFINRTTKLLLHRVRPHLWVSPSPEVDYGFPSGHAMSSMTLVMVLVVLTWGSRWCWLVLVLGGGFVLAIGWTRLYLGVHYPSDILAGWMASIAWAIGVRLLLKFPPLPKKA